ncbi:MAG: hypothetical protein ABJN26_06085 [Stappiaceae bacterium]
MCLDLFGPDADQEAIKMIADAAVTGNEADKSFWEMVLCFINMVHVQWRKEALAAWDTSGELVN